MSFVQNAGPAKIKSSILGGEIQFLDGKRNLSGIQRIKEGEFLSFLSSGNILIQKIQLNRSALRIHLEGTFDQILIGSQPSDLVLANPNLFSWYLKNYESLLISIFLVAIALTFLLLWFTGYYR